MEIITTVLGWLPTFVVLLILIGGATALIAGNSRSAREWLLLAVTESEKALGSGTGQLKLRATYEAFIKNFPLLSKFISFGTFSSWVDVSLAEMRKMLETSSGADKYVKGDN